MSKTALVLTGFLFVFAGCGPRSDDPAPEAPSAETPAAAKAADSAFDLGRWMT